MISKIGKKSIQKEEKLQGMKVKHERPYFALTV